MLRDINLGATERGVLLTMLSLPDNWNFSIKIFSVMFSPKALEKLPEDEIVIKTWQAINETDPDYSAAHFNKLMTELVITDQDKEKLSIYMILYLRRINWCF